MPWLFADVEYSESGSLVSALFAPLAKMVPTFAPFPAVLLLFPAAVSAFRQWKERKLPDSPLGSGSLPALNLLDWKQFESHVAEYYRRKGYRVRPTANGPDGGVDLRLTSDSGLYLVQCKHWRRDKVGVKIVRELYGVMAAEGAYGGAVVTSGSFSAKARAFADGKPMELVDGPQLQAMLSEVQRSRGGAARDSTVATSELRMTLDHEGGAMDGEILTGAAAGRRLSHLDLPDLRAVFDQLSGEDSRQLLGSYLDRRYPGWSDEAPDRGGGTSARTTAEMDAEQALAVLGLAAGASEKDIKEAYRRLMQKLHPDRGGTDYFAKELNLAKEVLINGQ